jgi:hypothetical protein
VIDTVYEYAGLTLAESLRSMLAGSGLPLILGLAGTAWMVHQVASEKAPVRELGVHLGTLLLVWGLLSPAASGPVRSPRFLLWLGEGADLLQRRAVRRVNERFLDRPFEWERLAALASMARVLDPALQRRVDEFLEGCARPALAREEPRGANLLAAGTLSYPPACEERRAAVERELAVHVERHPSHRAALEAAGRHDPSSAAAFHTRYLETVALRAIDDPDGGVGERELVRASLGTYSYVDRAQSTGAFPAWAKGVAGWVWPDLWDAGANAALSGLAELHQSWNNRWTAKQQYFLVSTYGPHVYGLSLLFLGGLFPVAGLWALLPGKWTALVHFAKVFLSVKLWPVLWAALTQWNARRSAVEAFDPGERGSGDVFLAVAALYLLTPGIAFLLVHLAARAAAIPFQPAVPAAAGPGSGPAGAGVRGVSAAR